MRDMETRGTYSYSFKIPKVDRLIAMESRLTSIRRSNFQSNYGAIIDLLHVQLDTTALGTLAQFYDPPLRCFTFRDFQLFPTIEEFDSILGLKKDKGPCYLREIPTPEDVALALQLEDQDSMSFQVLKTGVQGFARKALEDKAQFVLEKGNWKAYNAILALLIYGLVLFPNVKDFIDITAIGVFLTKNPAPTLLGDFLYSLHDRNGTRRGGQISCCAPLVQKWLMSHLPDKGPLVDNESLKWSERLNSLTEKDIRWYSPHVESSKVLLKCGDFPNVPLVGTQGCINYNPVLSLRQLGYPMVDAPSEITLTPFVLKKDMVDLELWGRIKKAWLKVEKSVVKRKNCLAREAYTQWVKDRILRIQLPFSSVVPEVVEEPEPIITISKEEADALRNQIAQLKKENEELQFKCFSIQGEAKSFKRERDAKDEEMQGCKKKVKEAQEREEKYKDGLASSNLSIKALKEDIKSLKRSNDEMYATGNKAMIAQGDWKKKFEEKTQELKKVQQEFKKLQQEKELELQKKEKLHSQERRKDKESMQRYEESLAQIMRAHEDQMTQVAEQIEHLEKNLKYHKTVIEMSLQEMARWKEAFRKMLLVSTSVLDEMPRMLRMAEAEVPFLNVSGAVKEFVCYCRAVVTAYKNVVKKAKKGL
ncbi:hypothetical protein QL285_021697 [Trifolium repens]|nr:hypothetical protein QL285_039307 [Trifolium repens]KAK2436725.1 hypothetical protein QL285_021697 [Trifolium repens]